MSQIIDDVDLRFSEEAQEQLLNIFQESLASAASVKKQADEAMQIVKQETAEMQNAQQEVDETMEQLEDEVYEEEEAYNQDEIMPDEENDLSELSAGALD